MNVNLDESAKVGFELSQHGVLLVPMVRNRLHKFDLPEFADTWVIRIKNDIPVWKKTHGLVDIVRQKMGISQQIAIVVEEENGWNHRFRVGTVGWDSFWRRKKNIF
jgi:hypothetical protein